MKKKKEVVYAFIDSQNLNLGVKSQGWSLDFGRFRVFLKDRYQAQRAFLFIGFIPKHKELYKRLEEKEYKVIFKPVVQGSPHKKIKVKGNVDAELVLHTIIRYRNYSQAIIVSGDGDFHCLIEYLEKYGKLKKIIVPNKKYSSLLRKFAPYIVNINQFKDKLKQ